MMNIYLCFYLDQSFSRRLSAVFYNLSVGGHTVKQSRNGSEQNGDGPSENICLLFSRICASSSREYVILN